MKIENEKIRLLSIPPGRFKKFSAEQNEMLALLQKSHTISEVVQHYFQKGILISFVSFVEVIETLLNEKMVVNSSFYDYFKKDIPKELGVLEKMGLNTGVISKPEKPSTDFLKKIPFFRSLHESIFEIFVTNSTLMNVSAGITLCQEGSPQRSLLLLVKGRATVYKKDEAGRAKKVVVLGESAVFGETGFFLNEPRTASIITDTDCTIMMFKYIPEIYDSLIKTESAKQLRSRIWTIHALVKSEVFRSLPPDCFDALILAGELKLWKAGLTVCRQGEPGASCYLIVKGSVNVVKNGKLIRNLSQGDVFGELALMITGGARTATVEILEDAILLEINRNNFYKLLSENLLLACEFEKLARLRTK